MPSKTAKKTTTKKSSSKPNGEDVAKVIVEQLNNIQTKLNDLNSRVSKLETLNIKSMETDNRFVKIENRLGL